MESVSLMASAPILSEPLFYSVALAAGDEIVLTGDEANHIKVQRLQTGAPIALFDGFGLVVRGNIRTISRREVRVVVTDRRHVPARIPRVELYCAVPKGDRMSVLLDMATQLGMHGFTPIRWQRGVVEPGARSEARWRRICIEACKQSRRLRLPEITTPMTLADGIARARGFGACMVVAHPQSGISPALVPTIAEARGIALFIGPEGGLTDGEIRTLQVAEASFVDLGDAVLRIETAAVALLVAVSTVVASRTAPSNR
jgi:16S rRNA (uracil1498-N3)-methyltransferase